MKVKFYELRHLTFVILLKFDVKWVEIIFYVFWYILQIFGIQNNIWEGFFYVLFKL